jgi:nitronate monooxygenase
MGEQVTDSKGAALLTRWRDELRAPIIAAPMFLVSNPALVIAQCTSGIMGTFPALNARPASQFEDWLIEIGQALATWDRNHPGCPAAPFGVNLIVHRSNPRLEEDLALCEKYAVPLVISSMGAREEVNRTVQDYGGVTLHDVTSQAHAHKALEKGATGLIAVAAGAGGHAGRISPFALIEEIRAWFDGPLVLSGAIGTGRAVAAARAIGADLAYVGSAFIATEESAAFEAQKQGMLTATAEDIVYTPAFSGTPANYLRASIEAAGLDPDNLPNTRREIDLTNPDRSTRTWTDIWGCGQGVGSVHEILPTATLIDRMVDEYHAALVGLSGLAQRMAAAHTAAGAA